MIKKGDNAMTYLDTFSDYLHNERKLSQNTLESYIRDVKMFCAFLKNRKYTIDTVTKTVLISYLILLQKEGKTTATISRHLASLRCFFNFLVLCSFHNIAANLIYIFYISLIFHPY